ncbi:relaxase MobL [Amycolatopsis sp. TNS106]|uniref:relaxase MobL n=1 Tax=Amycolatopsis sp. TNS106 TaxID=2861750 RepID=UPI001C593ABC|nr:relaxase MobL [Amycolatopsis sp. TNS106]QXV57381.1 hypothetical protein CVV72_10395 [Amycolatopsis sp. TNS106]
MTLRASIVIVNEFSVPLPEGKGTRGATPGHYITRYMAREQATEPLAPIHRQRTDDFLERYAARDELVRRAMSSHVELGPRLRRTHGDGGLAFGYGSVSLSHDDLHAASRDIQKRFNSGKTVLKTVISFDEAYLKSRRILSTDFHCTTRGAYRGHVDQMKLRMSIMHGLDRMASGTNGFDDLRYVGVIQVDTSHVHCHLAMIDAGNGSRARDGTQRGKLLTCHKSRLRRGIDAWLEEKQAAHHLSSAVGYDHRNVTTFIKRWAHERISAESLPQFLVACLPAERHLWRTGTHDPRMRKPDRLLTTMVSQHLARPGSPMPAAMQRIIEHANLRRERENLADHDWQRRVEQSRARIVTQAVDAVYQMLRTLPEAELRVRTPVLDVMGLDYSQMAALAAGTRPEHDTSRTGVDLLTFGLRLRGCAARLGHHLDQARVYEDVARQWEQAEKSFAAMEDSRPLYDFYRFEEHYHRQLVRKYRHILPFTVDTTPWREQQHRIAVYDRRLHSLKTLRDDSSLSQLDDPVLAEQLGREIHGQPGGRLLLDGSAGRAVLDARIATIRKLRDESVDSLRSELFSAGLDLRTGSGADELTTHIETSADPVHEFDQVKALDLHHLGHDFISDVPIGPQAHRTFTRAAAERRRLLLAAIAYLDDSGQPEAISDLPVTDVAAMTRLSRELHAAAGTSGTLLLRSKPTRASAQSGPTSPKPRSSTVSLDTGLAALVHEQIATTVINAEPEHLHQTDTAALSDVSNPIR